MLQYKCDWCSRLKKPGEVWILGFAAVRHGARSTQIEFNVLSKWNNCAAQDPLAVHFCSTMHQQKYVDIIFNTSHARSSKHRGSSQLARMAPPLRNQSVAGISRQRPDQRIPLGIHPAAQRAQAALAQLQPAAPAPTPAKPPAPKRRTVRFTAQDKRWAHEIGVSLVSKRRKRT